MSQVSNYAVSDGSGVGLLAALNALFGAVQSVNSGTAAPGSPVPGMPWLDTSVTPPVRRRRNAANTGWDLDDLSAVGLGATTITALTDVSNLTVPGFYYASSGATGLPAVTSAYAIEHFAAPTANGGVNMAFALASDRAFIQRKSGGVWQAWVEIPTGATATGLAVLQAANGPAGRTALGAYGSSDLAAAADIAAATAGLLVDAATLAANKLVLGTAQATTSGTSKDFTGIPSWAKRITVMFNEVSTSGTSSLLVQVGSGAVQTSGYASTGTVVNNAGGSAGVSATNGMALFNNLATSLISGKMTFANMGANVWVQEHSIKGSTINSLLGGGVVSLSGALDRLRITTVNGTDTFDAGSVNIMWE